MQEEALLKNHLLLTEKPWKQLGSCMADAE